MRFLTLADALVIAETVTGINARTLQSAARIDLAADPDDAVEFMCSVAAGTIDVHDATEWIDRHAKTSDSCPVFEGEPVDACIHFVVRNGHHALAGPPSDDVMKALRSHDHPEVVVLGSRPPLFPVGPIVVTFALKELPSALLRWSVEQNKSVEHVVQFGPSAVRTFEDDDVGRRRRCRCRSEGCGIRVPVGRVPVERVPAGAPV